MISKAFSTKEIIIPPLTDPKLCKTCGLTKRVIDFDRHSSYSASRDNTCKECRREQDKQRYLAKRAKETVEIFGQAVSKYTDCSRCQSKLTVKFAEGLGYMQPCRPCRSTDEYRAEQEEAQTQAEVSKRIDNAMQGRLPVAVHEYKGRYLYTNHKGDILKDEKVRPMGKKEKWKK